MKKLSEEEVQLISKVFQNYLCSSIDEIAEDNETARGLFCKIGLLEEGDEA